MWTNFTNSFAHSTSFWVKEDNLWRPGYSRKKNQYDDVAGLIHTLGGQR